MRSGFIELSTPHQMACGPRRSRSASGVRTFRATGDGNGSDLDVQERFTGPLGPMAKQVPDLQPPFENIADGLKARGEQGCHVAAPRVDPFEALGDPTRLRILQLLGSEPQSVAVLAEQPPVSRPAVSRHLRVLKETIRVYLEQVWGEAAARLRSVAENTEAGDR